MRIVLFGKNGQVGWELQQLLPKFGNLTSLGREDLDVSNIQALQNILDHIKPHLIINASAYTNVDRAEKESTLAMKVNAKSPGVMAETANKLKAIFIHYSTDYVFDGNHNIPYTEDEKPNPLNIYGKSKLEGEKNIARAGGAYLILRTSWVYSMRGNTFVNKVLSWARTNKTLKIVNDQFSNPTWASALAEATSLLLSQNSDNLYQTIFDKRGTYHLAGSGYTSRFEWANQILANASNRTDLLVQAIEPVSSEEFPFPAQRPLFSALDCSKFEKTFGIRLPDWKKSLKTAMEE